MTQQQKQHQQLQEYVLDNIFCKWVGEWMSEWVGYTLIFVVTSNVTRKFPLLW